MSLIQAVMALGKFDLADGKVLSDFYVTATLPGQDPVLQTSDTPSFKIDVTAAGVYAIRAGRKYTDGTLVAPEVVTTWETPAVVVPPVGTAQVDAPVSITLSLVP